MKPSVYIQFIPIVLFLILTPMILTIPPSKDSVTGKKQLLHNPFKSDILAATLVHTLVFGVFWLLILCMLNKDYCIVSF